MSKLLEALKNIKRNVEGIRNDEEAFHKLREDLGKVLIEHKNLEMKLLLRWDEMSKDIDTIIGEVERRNGRIKKEINYVEPD